MIDLIVNTEGGVTVAHEDPRLDEVASLEVSRATGAARLLLKDGSEVALAPVAPALRDGMREGMPARAIRMARGGWAVAAVRDMGLSLVD